MANVMFTGWKQVQVGDAAITGFTLPNWETSTIKFTLIDTADDSLNPQTDQDIADLAAAARVATGTLSAKTAVASGNNVVCTAGPLSLPAVTGDSAEHAVIWFDSGTEATSLLLVHFDTFTAGMPVIPNGGEIVITPHASGIVQI